jgi:site-specific DNA-adenine methylase
VIELIWFTPCSRKLFYDLRSGEYLPLEEPDVQRAYKDLVMMSQSFSGSWHTSRCSWGNNIRKCTLTSKIRRYPQRLLDLVDRIKHVQIEYLDFERCISKYDTPGTLFYCDPPYVDAEGYYKKSAVFGEDEHRRLADLLNHAQGKVCLSYYPHPLVDELYTPDRWDTVRLTTLNQSQPNNLNRKRTKVEEILLMRKDENDSN